MKIDKQESVLETFYLALASSNNKALHEVHIPMSDVFYVRAAHVRVPGASANRSTKKSGTIYEQI